LYGTQDGDQINSFNGDDHLHGLASNDDLYGGDDNDQLHGNGGDDQLHGGNGFDYLHGNEGNDTLNGGSDDDYLYGNTGDDRINGGLGKDFMVGGDGADIYEFTSTSDSLSSAPDVIEGFISGTDQLDFSALNVNASDISVEQVNGEIDISVSDSDFQITLIATTGVDVDTDIII
jgi:Ca2+-binding RTX toxin-like protein